MVNTEPPCPSSTIHTLFQTVRDNHLTSAAIYSWETLRIFFPPEILETSFHLNRATVSLTDLDIMKPAIQILNSQLPDLCFIYLEGTDLAGHAHGWMSASYFSALQLADQAVNLLMSTLENNHLINKYTVLLLSDHGGVDTNHCDPLNEVMTIPWIVCGEGIRKKYELRSPVSILDTAPTVARILNITPHCSWRGHVQEDIFLSPAPHGKA
jgi:predicted AlkP superfamily pyrophosphatase or phosphodiesterase